jgi:outer membrane protein insertion porin family
MLCLGLFLCPAWSQTSRFEGRPIRELRYDPVKQPLSAADLQRVQQLQIGERLRSSDVAGSIDAMFATGRYEDIQVEASETPTQDGVTVTFRTRAARFIGHVGAAGKIKAPPDEGQLVNTANLEPGTPFHPDVLAAVQKNIEQLYRSNGFFNAQVHLETQDESDAQQVDVSIVVNSGTRARYEAPVIHGETKLPEGTIYHATGWRFPIIHRWRAVSAQRSRQGVDGVERKYQSQDRLSATVDLKSLDYDSQTNRVKPTLEIEAGPKIKVQATESKVSKRLLRRYVPIYEEGSVDRDLLVEGARNLRDHFQAAGYTNVDVTFRELPATGDERAIEYAIARGPRQKLVRVEIRGNRQFKTDMLFDRMFLRPNSFRYRGGRYSEAFLHKDETTIANLYKDHGYREVHVTSEVQPNYRGKPANLAVTINIVEGPQWTVAHLDARLGFDGLDEATQKATLAKLHSTEGKPYSDLGVAEDRSAILTLCHGNGFPHATFHAKATPASAPHQVNLEYTVEEGGREFVRGVLIAGLKVTKPRIVMQNIKIAQGDPLSLTKLRDSQHDLYDRGVFAKVNAVVQNSDGNETQENVLYDFTEAHRYNFTVGIGAELARIGGTVATVNAAQEATGFVPRVTLTLDRLNCFGLAQTLTLQTRLSTLEQRAAVSYAIPRAFDVEHGTLTITALYDLNRDVLTFASRREEASLQWTQKLTKHNTVLGRFAYRRVSTSDVVIPSLLVPQLLQPVRIGIFSGNWVVDYRDNPTDAHKGFYNAVDGGVASSAFGSQRNFIRLLERNATYHRLTKNLVLARQTTVGIILPFNTPADLTVADAVPLPERFFGGGSLSDRAFPENQAGPRDIGTPAGPGGTATQPTGFPLGGNAEFFNNVELRFPLIGDNIGGVLFHDMGNVYSSVGAMSFRFHQNGPEDFDYMVHSVGFGIRYKTPIGPVRADFAYSINPPHFVGFNGSLTDLLACNPNLPASALPGVCTPVAQGVSHFQFFFSIGQTF